MTTAWMKRPEGGGQAALRLIRAVAMLFGRPVARAVLYPVAAYFVIRRRPERMASRRFLSRALGRPATQGDVFRHFHAFAAVTLDRVFLLSDRFQRFDVRCHGLEQLHRAMDLERGVLLFGAHFGSFEALRVLSLQRNDVKFRVVIDLEQNPTVSALLNSLNPQLAGTVINARQSGTTVALAIREGLEQKALVTLLADRSRPGNRVIAVPFLGSPAPFPTAAWELAAALHAPVVLCFGIYNGANRYDLHFELFAEEITHDRRNRQATMKHWIGRYAERLEAHVRKAPFNWFNFYDFWET
jgi:predicted LPLAT superfamily acyltransferase